MERSYLDIQIAVGWRSFEEGLATMDWQSGMALGPERSQTFLVNKC